MYENQEATISAQRAADFKSMAPEAWWEKNPNHECAQAFETEMSLYSHVLYKRNNVGRKYYQQESLQSQEPRMSERFENQALSPILSKSTLFPNASKANILN